MPCLTLPYPAKPDYPQLAYDRTGRAEEWLRSGHTGICFDYSCLDCAVSQFRSHFACAEQCTREPHSVGCSDCSYTYDNSHSRLLELRQRLWEGYLLGGFGEYIITDFLDANFTSCALERKGCIDTVAYELDALGIGASPPVVEGEGDGPGGLLMGFDT